MPFVQSYTNIFGGNQISTVFPSYIAYDLTGDITLNWASSFVDNSNVVANIMDFTSTPVTTLLGNNPLTSANGTGVVTVTVVSTANLISGQFVTISGATTFNNLTAPELNITAAITVISATQFTYNTTGTANATSGGGGNAVNLSTSLYVVTLPDSRLVSTGQTININNPGTNSVVFHDNAGGVILTVNPGISWQLYLRDNSTAAGTWGLTQNGAGTTQAQATQLITSNSGLTIINGLIDVNMPNKTINANYQILSSDRANLLIWTGGVGTFTMPTLATVGNGFYIGVNNQGGGNLTINTGDGTTIDGNPTLTLQPGQSTFIDGGSANWNTIGYGQNSVFQYTAVSINVAGNSNVNLTNQQASNQIINLTGVLTGNITVTWPTVTGVWYVFNNTSGLFTIQANGGLNIPQSEKVILYCDGTTFYLTPTVATSVVFNDGNAANPSIAFASDPTSGFYKVGAASWGFSSAGANALTLGALSNGQTGFAIAANDVLRLVGTNAGFYATLKAGNMAGNVNWTWPIADSVSAHGVLQSDAAGTLSFSTATYPVTTTVNQLLYSSATNTIVGLPTANSSTLITSAGGVPSLSQTLPTAVQANITTLGTITTGIWQGTPVGVVYGGTGLATLTTAYGVVCAGTTATGALQNAGAGTANQVFTSNGAGALPSWKAITIALPAAVKADQTTGTSTTVYVNPAVQQFHDSAVKAWIMFRGTDGTVFTSYNANVARLATGDYRVTFTTAFASANYCWSINMGNAASSGNVWVSDAPYGESATTTTFRFSAQLFSSGTFDDPQLISATFYGRQ